MNKNLQSQILQFKFVIIASILLLYTGSTYANKLTYESLQEKTVTLNVSNKGIKFILDEIYKQTKISFVIKGDENLTELSNLSIHVENKSVSYVLDKLFVNTSFTYAIDNNVVSIYNKARKNMVEKPERVVVSGKVVDKKSKKPVIGATIVVTGKTTGAISDEKGAFSFSAESNDKLEITFVGKKPVTYTKPLSSKSLIIIEMDDDIVGIDDVVITGYGSVNRADMVGATTTLVADDIKIQGKSNIAEMLQGQVAGLVVTNSSARAGATPKLQIRGQSTLSNELGNQSPIWVVDGVIQDDPINITGNMAGADDIKSLIGNQVSWLNPNDIETVTVLKDASATAIYGSRASNGVIVIVTKMPKSEEISVNYSGSLTINSKPKYRNFDYMNSKERITITEELYDLGLTYAELPVKQMNTFDGILRSYIERDITQDQYSRRRGELETMNTDWFDMLTRTSISQDHNVSLSGKISNKLSVRGSVGYKNNLGQELKNGSTLLSARISLNAKINDRLVIDYSVSGSKTGSEGTSVGASSAGGGSTPLEYAKRMSRSIPAYNEDGTDAYYNIKTSYTYNNESILSYNFLNEINQTSAKSISGRLAMNFKATYSLTDWLKYEFVGGYTYSESSREVFRSERSFTIANQYRGYDYSSVLPSSAEYKAALMPHGGTFGLNRATGNSYNIQNKLLFSKTVNEKHRFNAMLVNEIRSTENSGIATAMWGFLPDRGNTFAKPPINIIPISGNYSAPDYGLLADLYNGKNSITGQTNNFISLFATFAYSFSNKYVLNANIRNDMSNRFGQNVNNRFDPTYSFGLKWNVTNEEFMANRLNWLTYLNISITYGIQGNALLSKSPDLILTKGGVHSIYNEFTSTVSSIPNPYLTWERTSNWNYSISTRLFDMFNFNVDYYTRESNANVSQEIGYENGLKEMSVNGGIIHNKGIEFSIAFNPINSRDFGLNISLNSSKNWNKGGESTLDTKSVQEVNSYLSAERNKVVKEGYPIGSIWSYVFSHLDDEYGSPRFKYMDANPESAKIDPTSILVHSGQADPFFTGGMSLNFRYKRLSLSSMFSLILGSKKRLPSPYGPFGSAYNKLPRSEVNLSKDLNKRWQKPGDELTTYYPGLAPGSPDNIVVPGQMSTRRAISMWEMSDVMVVDGGFLRCNNVSLSYNLDSKVIKQKLGISRLSIAGSVSNPFVFGSDRFGGFDPELGNSVMPKTFSLSLNIGF